MTSGRFQPGNRHSWKLHRACQCYALSGLRKGADDRFLDLQSVFREPFDVIHGENRHWSSAHLEFQAKLLL